MKKNLIYLLALVFPVLGISAAHADDDRVSAVIEMQDADIASLKQTGYMKMKIPRAMLDRVDSVILKRPVRFKDESAILYNDVDRRNAMVAVSVDDSTLEQIDYQPVELKIYESGFSSIVVRYRPGNSTSPQKASKKDSAIFVTNLANSKSLTGRIADMKEFTIKSGLGKIDVKLDEVSHLTFQEDGRATVELENGDQLSGKIAFRNITIKSRWGLEDLKVADIVSISKPFNNAIAAPSAGVITHNIPQPISIPQPAAIPLPTSIAQPIEIPQPINQGSIYSPLQSFSYPANAYDPNQRIDVVPESLEQPIGQGYDPYTGQQLFDQAYDQLMQPIDPSSLPVESLPVDQNFGPFFGEPIPIGPQPVGGFGEIIQDSQGIPPVQSLPAGGFPEAGSDFWFFPQ